MFRKHLVVLAAGASLLAAGVAQSVAAELKVSGAATVAGDIIIPNKAAIEKTTGLTLNVVVNGDGNGLKDLYGGKVDVMMVAAPLKATADALNKINPGSVSTDGLQFVQLGAVGIKFILNPKNPVKSLTAAQVKDIFTGKITSWKDVGGADQPIMVVVEPPGNGTRTNVVSGLLDGADITGQAHVMQALVQVAQVVGQAPNAIGYGNSASITPADYVVPGVDVKQPIGLATKGAPNGDVQKLIAAAQQYSASVR